MNKSQALVLAPLHTVKAGAIWGDAWREFMGIGTEGSGAVREYTGQKGDYNRATLDAWVARCLEVRGSAISSVPMKVYAPTKDGKREPVDHDALGVLQSTNPVNWDCGQKLHRSTLASLDVHGHFAWQLAFGYNRLPTEIYFMPPGAYEPVPDKKTGFFAGVKIRDGDKDRIVPASQLVYDATTSLIDPLKGSSRIQAIKQELNLRAYSLASNLWWFRNNQRPEWLLTGDFAPTNDNVERLRRQINQWSGGDNRRGPLILGGGNMTAHLFTPNAKDMEWLAGLREAQQTIASGFGVPMTLMNVLEHATLTNVDALERIFWRTTMIPELDGLADSLTHNFLWRWPDAFANKLCLGYDYSQIEGLTEDIGQIFEREMKVGQLFTEHLKEGALVPNQVRKLMVELLKRLGFDASPYEGEVPQGQDRLVNWQFVPSQQAGATLLIDGMAARGPNAGIIRNISGDPTDFESAAEEMLADQQATANDRAQAASQQPGQNNDQGSGKALPPVGSTSRAKTGLNPIHVRETRLAPIQAKAARRLRRYFQNLQLQALRALRAGQPESRKGAIAKIDLPEDYWDREQSIEDALEIVSDAILMTGAAAYDAAAQEYALGVRWVASNPWLEHYMGFRLDRIQGIDRTTASALKASLLEGAQAGESMSGLADRVTAVFRDAIDNRAETIARTETIQAYGLASLAAYRDGRIEKAQMYDGDNADSAECAEVNGMVVTLDEAAELMGDEHPNGTRGVAPFIELASVYQPLQDFPASAAKGVIVHPGAITIQILPG